MRKMRSSGKTEWMQALSSAALAASRPKGFSTTTRPSSAMPTRPMPWTTSSNSTGGMAR